MDKAIGNYGFIFMKHKEEIEQFKRQLDGHYSFPAEYPFKFIVPSSSVEELKSILPDTDLTENPSRSGKYTSISFKMKMTSSDEIIHVYLSVNKIKDIISL